MNLGNVRTAMANAMSVIPDVQVNAYALAQPTPPGIQILPGSVQYDQAFGRGLDEWTFTVQGFVALTSDIGSQVVLDQMSAPAGAGSVKAALEADRTLGGLVQSLHVLEQSAGAVVTPPGGDSPMLLVEWRVQVLGLGF